QAWHESADALAKAARSGRHLRRDTGPLQGRSRQALPDGKGIAGFRSRLAARLQRTHLFHPRLQTLDGIDAPPISIVAGRVNNRPAKSQAVAPDGSGPRVLEAGASVIPSLP